MRLKFATSATIAFAMFVGFAVPAQAVTVSGSGPITQLGSSGHWYQYVTTSSTPTQAEAISASGSASFNGLPGHLVTITSPEENAIVRSISGTDAVWIGAARTPRALSGTYDWAWLAGPESEQSFTTCVNNFPSCNNIDGQYTNWDTAHQQPDGDLWNEDAVEMEGSDLTSGAWGDCYSWGNCHISGYVIEYEPDWSATAAQVADLRAVAKSSSTVSLSWVAPVVAGTQIVDYSIDFRDALGIWNNIPHASSPSNTFVVSGLSTQTAYQFRVSPIFSNGMTGRKVLATDTLAQVGDGEFHGCSLSSDGAVQCWGNQGAAYGAQGLLGTGDLADSLTPRAVKLSEPALKISVGAVSTCAIGLSQMAYCWGGNRFGELGIGTFDTNENTPKPVSLIGPVLDIATSESWIYNDQSMTCAVAASGDGYCWGLGILGDGSTINGSTLYQQSALPQKVSMPAGVKFKSVSTSGYNTCFLSESEALYCFGENANGQVGIGQSGAVLTPTKVDGVSGVSQVSMSWSATCAINSQGDIYCWGDNTWGQLGIGTFDSANIPKLIGQSMDARQVSAGGTDVCSISSTSVLSCWGDGRWDRNGNTGGTANAPKVVDPGTSYKSVSNGPESTCALSTGNEVRCWGVNAWYGISHFGIVTGWSSGFGPEAERYVVTSTSSATFLTTSSPEVTGSSSVGNYLFASLPSWDAGASSQWQWRRDGAVIDGANSSDYRLQPEDAGRFIDASVTVSKSGYQTETRVSQPVGPIQLGIQRPHATPIVSGDVRVGSEVTVVTQVISQSTQKSFQWLSDGHTITGETRASIQIRPELISTSLSVRVTEQLFGYLDLIETSENSLVLPGRLVTTSVPVLVGTPVPGTTLSLDSRLWDSGVWFDYSWYRSGVQIQGQVSSRYLIVDSDVGSLIVGCVTGSKLGYTTQSICSAGATVLALQKNTPTPALSGTLKVGSVLTAKPGNWDVGVLVTYQWLRAGIAIPGATASTYALLPADLGSQISVITTGSKPGYMTVSRTSVPTAAIVPGTLALAPIPTISGTTKVGNALSVKTGTWDVGVVLTYQWLRNGTNISGAVASTYSLIPEDLASKISVTVSGSKAGYGSLTRSSASTAAIGLGALSSTPVPTISGNLTVGSVVTVSTGAWDNGVTFAYQWKRGTSNISGASSSTYTLTAADKGASIAVTVTGSKNGYTSVTRTSLASKSVK